MTAGALIKPEAFARAEMIDAELGWQRGTAIGRMATLYSRAQGGKGVSIAKRRLILDWTCVEPEHAAKFLELCCSVDDNLYIHFLEPRSDDCYFIVGNPGQIAKIETFKRRASAGGVAKARKVRAAKAKTAPDSASSTASTNAPSDASSIALGSASALPLSLSSSLSVSGSSSVSPLTPRKRGATTAERKRRRWARDTATAWATKAVGAVRNGLDPSGAQAFVGADGWALLLAKHASWDGFVKEYAIATTQKRSGGNDAVFFESQLTKSFQALLLQAPATYEGTDT